MTDLKPRDSLFPSVSGCTPVSLEKAHIVKIGQRDYEVFLLFALYELQSLYGNQMSCSITVKLDFRIASYIPVSLAAPLVPAALGSPFHPQIRLVLSAQQVQCSPYRPEIWSFSQF